MRLSSLCLFWIVHITSLSPHPFTKVPCRQGAVRLFSPLGSDFPRNFLDDCRGSEHVSVGPLPWGPEGTEPFWNSRPFSGSIDCITPLISTQLPPNFRHPTSYGDTIDIRFSASHGRNGRRTVSGSTGHGLATLCSMDDVAAFSRRVALVCLHSTSFTDTFSQAFIIWPRATRSTWIEDTPGGFGIFLFPPHN